jgi:hypothetical protein
MAQLLKQQKITDQEAVKLVERLLNHAVPAYLIRDELVERGFSGYDALRLIDRVSASTRAERITNPDDTRSLLIALGLFVGLTFFIIVLLMLAQ